VPSGRLVEKIDAGPKGGTLAFRGNTSPIRWLIQFIGAACQHHESAPRPEVVVARDWPTPEGDRPQGRRETVKLGAPSELGQARIWEACED
jgi:hypothetical protein